jgi:hypothetical protein
MRADDVRIADPCPEDFDAMHPDRPHGATRRFCDRCTKHVHDLSAMTEAQARQVLAGTSRERVCVRYLHDDEGRILFRPAADVVPIASLARRREGKTAAALALMLAACAPHDNPDIGRPGLPATDPAVHSTGTTVVVPTAPAREPRVYELQGDVEPVRDPSVPAVEAEPIPRPAVEPIDRAGGEPEPCDPAAEPARPPVHTKQGTVAPKPRPDVGEVVGLMG